MAPLTTEHQKEILKALRAGESPQAIAGRLSVHVSVVKNLVGLNKQRRKYVVRLDFELGVEDGVTSYEDAELWLREQLPRLPATADVKIK